MHVVYFESFIQKYCKGFKRTELNPQNIWKYINHSNACKILDSTIQYNARNSPLLSISVQIVEAGGREISDAQPYVLHLSTHFYFIVNLLFNPSFIKRKIQNKNRKMRCSKNWKKLKKIENCYQQIRSSYTESSFSMLNAISIRFDDLLKHFFAQLEYNFWIFSIPNALFCLAFLKLTVNCFEYYQLIKHLTGITNAFLY